MTARSKDLARLGGTLRRVRVAERATPDGGKKVWHQGEGGVEVISFVEPRGHVTRQEIYVAEVVVVWNAGAAFSSGKLARPDSATDAESVLPDSSLQPSALTDAHSVMEGYGGDDRYLLHLRDVLRSGTEAPAALPLTGMIGDEVTGYARRVTDERPLGALAVPKRAAAPRRMALVAAAVVGGLAAYLLLRA